jgi:hypothetical protein
VTLISTPRLANVWENLVKLTFSMKVDIEKERSERKVGWSVKDTPKKEMSVSMIAKYECNAALK